MDDETMKEIKTKVAKATVRLTNKGDGQGVLIPGHLILTAAHCINWSTTGEMAQANHNIEKVETSTGIVHLTPLAVEPVSDIAVLGALDNQEFPSEVDEFEKFCDDTKPIVISVEEHDLFEKFQVCIRSHKDQWIRAQATQCASNAEKLAVQAEEQVECGTSGGPIIDRHGQLIGIVSWFSTAKANVVQSQCHGATPRPHKTLPVWVLERACKSQSKNVAVDGR